MEKDLKQPDLKLRIRFRVHLLDIFALTMATIIVQSLLWEITSEFLWSLPKLQKHRIMSTLFRSRGMINFINFSLLFFAYHILSYFTFEGRTLGAVIMKTRLVSKRFRYCNHYKLNFWDSFERTLGLYLLSLSWIVPLLVPLVLVNYLRKDKRGLADFLGRTYCLSEANFQKYKKEAYNKTLPVPLDYFNNQLPYHDLNKSA